MKKIFRFIIPNPKYITLLNCINNKSPNMLKLGKEADFHYAHIRTVLRQFQQEEIIKPIFDTEEANKQYNPGDPYIVELTEKGKLLNKVLQAFLMIQKEINLNEVNKFLGGKNGK